MLIRARSVKLITDIHPIGHHSEKIIIFKKNQQNHRIGKGTRVFPGDSNEHINYIYIFVNNNIMGLS